jgi:hypothetical protein
MVLETVREMPADTPELHVPAAAAQTGTGLWSILDQTKRQLSRHVK